MDRGSEATRSSRKCLLRRLPQYKLLLIHFFNYLLSIVMLPASCSCLDVYLNMVGWKKAEPDFARCS